MCVRVNAGVWGCVWRCMRMLRGVCVFCVLCGWFVRGCMTVFVGGVWVVCRW